MPFLIPAVLSATADALILFLGRHLSFKPDSDTDHWVYNARYLAILAGIRIALLALPLLFHSYTGTALRCTRAYQLLYFGTLMMVAVHFLTLAMMNPEALEALLPIDAESDLDKDLLHEIRRLYWIMELTVISNICHVVMFMHVRSTAPQHPLLQGKKMPSVYFTLRSQRSIQEPLSAMTGFVDDMQARLAAAKADWGQRLDDFTARLSSDPHHRPRLQNPLQPLTPFRVLLQLFAYEDVLENGRLDAVFEIDDGSSITFFVPQLLSFLLHGALFKSEKLEEWILHQCHRNIHFAHRCYWFLRAWCLEVPADSISNLSSRQNSDSRLSGLAPFLDEPASPQERIPCAPKRDRSRRGSSSEKFYSLEERAMIERLMLRVKETGEAAARVLNFGPLASGIEHSLSTSSSTDTAPTSNGHYYLPDYGTSPSDLMMAAESGTIPIDPSTGYPSVKHLDSISSPSKYGFLPLDQAPSSHPSETEQFDKTTHFLDALLFLADSLFHFDPKQRQEELRKQLRVMECELLPSNAIYVPIGNVHHRVWRIVAEESIPIGTKERVPCIVCLEVVDYNHKRERKSRAWSFLDRLPRRIPTSSETLESSTSSPHRRMTLEGIELPDFKSESETVNDWRFRQRDPLRRSSILDKVTVSMRGSMKGPLDKVLSSYRNHSMGEELRSLTITDTLAEESSSDSTDRADHSSPNSADIEHALDSLSGLEKRLMTKPGLARTSSGASLASMGQWTSPDPVDKRIVRPHDVGDSVRCRLSDVMGDDSDAPSLPYGSDHEEDRLHVGVSPPKGSRKSASSRRPMVVFRESWQHKEERIRAKSAYGASPGWRLLPILIKANDDLRQEQLAAQLIYRMAAILAREKVPVWLCPYEIIALTDSGGIIEAIPDTISLDSLKRNDPNYRGLKYFFLSHFGEGSEEFADAQANFVESLAAYSIVCFLLQLKDRHNGNILLDNRGHIIHIDFGFFFLSSPGKNVGFESAPFKLTRDFVDLLGGPDSRLFRTFRELCVKTFITLRRNCMEIILLVEMLKNGNEELNCFRGRPDEAIRQLRERFRLDLNDRACKEYVNSLVDNSIENWRTDWYDRYQRYFVGVL